MSDAPVGLRSIKKQLTRGSIADAALRLSLDKGLPHITIDEIAHLAFVSPRTVSNYFSCKEEAVVAAGNTLPALLALYASAPSKQAPMAAMRQVVQHFFETLSDEKLDQTRRWLQLIETNPSLRAYQMASYDEAEAEVRSIVATRTGIEDADDLYAGLVAAASIAAVKVVLGIWGRSEEPPRRLAHLAGAAFDHLETGFALADG
jgi:AcrR family transcriptional regulator